MDHRAEMKNATDLLAILQSYAPTGPAQAQCTALFHKAQTDGASARTLVRTMTNALSDGLNYSNWPWNTPPPRRDEGLSPVAKQMSGL